MDQKLTRDYVGSSIVVLLVAIGFYRGFFEAPTDVLQGEVYRIMYLHVPAAFSAFLAAFVMFIFAILGLIKGDEKHLRIQRAAAEVGLAFTVITLATGSIWGKPTWGTWWVWDARLTTTLILALLYAGFILLVTSMSKGSQRVRVGSILGLIITADVPIIYYSVKWWRTLHQPHSLFQKGKSPMSPEIKSVLLFCMLVVIIYCCWLIWQRAKNLSMADEVEELTYQHMT